MPWKSVLNKYQLTCSFLVFVVIFLTLDELKKVEYIPSLTDVKVHMQKIFHCLLHKKMSYSYF